MKYLFDKELSGNSQEVKLYKEVCELIGSSEIELVIYSWEGSWSPFQKGGRPTYMCVYSVNGLVANDRDNTQGKRDALSGFRPQEYGVPWNTLLHRRRDRNWSKEVRKTFWDKDGNLIEDFEEGFVRDVESGNWRIFTGHCSRTLVHRDISRIHKKPISPESPVKITI